MSGERLVFCEGSNSDDCPEDAPCEHFYPHKRIWQCDGDCPHVEWAQCVPEPVHSEAEGTGE